MAANINETKTASAANWQTTFDAINDGILIQDNERTIIQCNIAMANLLGKPISEIIGLKCWEIVHNTSGPIEGCPVLRTHKMQCSENEVIQLGDKWFKVTSDPLKENSGTLTGTVHIFTDITQSKKAELEYKTILKTAMDGFYVVDSQGHILDVNDSYCSLIGYSHDELLNMTLKDIDVIDSEEIIAQRIARITKVGWDRFETGHKCKDGRIIRIEASVNYMGIGNGKFYVFMRDITERKIAEVKIKASLEEKEVLLREIHHRVKNNMQIISSLLNFQMEYIKDKNIIDIFSESQNRILSMALVHEKLYQSSDLRNIDFKGYINDLGANLLQSYHVNNIKLNVNVENISLDIDLAIPAGLIINELITNSLKYAFPDGMKGEINISFRSVENMLELVVNDNGIGLPKDLEFRKSNTLGLHLVTSLAENQLHGKIDINRDKGTEFQIKFKGKNDGITFIQ